MTKPKQVSFKPHDKVLFLNMYEGIVMEVTDNNKVLIYCPSLDAAKPYTVCNAKDLTKVEEYIN